MAIQDILNKLSSELFMKNMRQHIVDGLEQVYKDATAKGDTNMEVLRARGSSDSLNGRLDGMDLQQITTSTELSQKASINYVDAILMDIAKGGPKGLFNSISILISTHPNGAEGTFLVMDSTFTDGAHSFLWDSTNSIWKDLGVYQATGIADGIVSLNKLDVEVESFLGNYRRSMNKKNLIPLRNFENLTLWDTPLKGTVLQKADGLVEGYKSTRLENKSGLSEMNFFKYPAKPNTPYSIEFKYKANSNHRVTAFAYNVNTHVNNVQINIVGDDQLNKGRIEITTGAGVTEIRLGFTLTTINTYMEITNPMMLVGLAQSEPYDLLEILNSMKEDIDPLKGKILYGDGDSIMEGAGFVGGFLKMIANKYSLNSHNIGVGGATIATGTTWSNGGNRHWISKSVEGLDKSCDYLMAEGSVNDYYNNVPLGEVSVGYRDSKSEFDTSNFAGAMEYLCMVLVTEFKGIDSVFILPHRINRIDYTTNAIGLTYQKYREVAKIVCRKYGVDFIDLGESSGLVTYWSDNKALYTNESDGLHPNILGYDEFYLPPLVDWMMSRSH